MGKKTAVLTVVTLAIVLMGALTSQVNTYVNGNVLTANQLNSEFGNIYSTINNLDNANLSDSSNIAPSKISATIDGSGISRDGGTGALSASVDGSTIEINSDQLRVKDAGITSAKILDGTIAAADLATGSVTSVKILDGTVALADMATSSVNSQKIVDASVEKEDMEPLISGGVTGGSGQAAVSPSNGTQTGLTGTGQVANHSVTLTTNGGAVLVTIQPTNSTTDLSNLQTSGGITNLQFTRAGTVLCSHRFSTSGSTLLPATSFSFIDFPAAGTHTYTTRYDVAGGTFSIANTRLMAYEL